MEICKTIREQVLEDDKGVFKIQNLEEIEIEILRNQHNLSKKFGVKQVVNYRSFKPSLFSKVMNTIGIAGYYNPFSAEAQYNLYLPDSHLPFTIAHESAHQLGFAREQEANFIGYLLGLYSKNKDLKYSVSWYVLKSLLRFQAEENSVFVEKVLDSFSDKMKRDYAYEGKFYEEYSGRLNEFFAIANDLFLKSNQQEGSVSYSYFIDLLFLYEIDSKKESHY